MRYPKYICLFIIFCGFTSISYTQVDKHALGLRSGGGGNGFGFANEVTYQLGLSSKTRLELDLGFRIFGNNGFRNSSYLALSGIYQWVKPIAGDFTWFYGVGGQIASASDSYPDSTGKIIEERYLSLGAGGQVGVDYSFKEFNVPIQLGFDVRPMIFIGNKPGNLIGGDLAIHARYIF